MDRHTDPTKQTDPFRFRLDQPVPLLVASTVAVVLLVLVIVDWSDPCRGQITDLLGCYAQFEEQEQTKAEEIAAFRATLGAEWEAWCEQEASTIFVRHPAFDAACFP